MVDNIHESADGTGTTWEVLLFVRENDAKALYYHGWFTFPMGHYRNIFERNTGMPYSLSATIRGASTCRWGSAHRRFTRATTSCSSIRPNKART
jgi:hypothetical protein